MKVIILVLSYNDGDIYTKFEDTQRKTWDMEEIRGIRTFYYHGNNSQNKIEGDYIFTSVDESLENCGLKTLKSFDLIKDFEFDFIFRTNSSSYIDKRILFEFIKNKPKDNFYCGVIGDHNGIRFCSGSGYFLSKDLFDMTIKYQNEWDHSYIDDVSLGKLLTSKGIQLTNASRVDLTSNSINIDNIPVDQYHYRCKTHDRNFDVNNMYLIKSKKDLYFNK